jgi:hypothetical protein
MVLPSRSTSSRIITDHATVQRRSRLGQGSSTSCSKTAPNCHQGLVQASFFQGPFSMGVLPSVANSVQQQADVHDQPPRADPRNVLVCGSGNSGRHLDANRVCLPENSIAFWGDEKVARIVPDPSCLGEQQHASKSTGPAMVASCLQDHHPARSSSTSHAGPPSHASASAAVPPSIANPNNVPAWPSGQSWVKLTGAEAVRLLGLGHTQTQGQPHQAVTRQPDKLPQKQRVLLQAAKKRSSMSLSELVTWSSAQLTKDRADCLVPVMLLPTQSRATVPQVSAQQSTASGCHIAHAVSSQPFEDPKEPPLGIRLHREECSPAQLSRTSKVQRARAAVTTTLASACTPRAGHAVAEACDNGISVQGLLAWCSDIHTVAATAAWRLGECRVGSCDDQIRQQPSFIGSTDAVGGIWLGANCSASDIAVPAEHATSTAAIQNFGAGVEQQESQRGDSQRGAPTSTSPTEQPAEHASGGCLWQHGTPDLLDADDVALLGHLWEHRCHAGATPVALTLEPHCSPRPGSCLSSPIPPDKTMLPWLQGAASLLRVAFAPSSTPIQDPADWTAAASKSCRDHASRRPSQALCEGRRDCSQEARGAAPPHALSQAPPLLPALCFDACFESANLRAAVRISPFEYDLFLSPDLNDISEFGLRCQWFYFALSAALPFQPYRFNIVNFNKKESLYSKGVQPLVSCPSNPSILHTGKSGALQPTGVVDWHRYGSEIAYCPSPYRVPARAQLTPPTSGGSILQRKGSGVSAAMDGGYPTLREGVSEKSLGGRGGSSCKGLYCLSFTMVFPSPDRFFLATCFPFTYSDLQEYLLKLALDSRALGLDFAGSDVIRRSLLCHTAAGNRCDLLTITDFTGSPETIAQREVVVLTARVHPGESNASWVMQVSAPR